MKISLNWVKEFTNVKISVDELVKKIGAQLGEVEEVVSLGERYEGITVAKVVSCYKHPNADKLSVCKIDDGGTNKKIKRDSKGLVQVVCGAPNVRTGITIAWIPPGAIVPSTYDKEQFKLDVRPLRGVDSNGMIASGKELGINDDHEGILILDKPAKPGTLLAEVYDLDDYIIEVENKMFTHRPDLFGMLGLAREIAGIQHVKFNSPEWYSQGFDKLKKGDKTLKLEVKNNIPKLVPRFMAVPMSGVKIGKSPIAMQSYLTRVGIKPINNVVDITNFVMMLTAQPLHAYDADKLPSPSLETRLSKKGDTLKLLGGKQVKFEDNKTILITSGDVPVGIGGVMGGADTEVDESTTNIILECANFDMYSIRRTAMAHGLFTDAVTRFNKGQSPMQNDIVLSYAAGMLQKHASAEVVGKIIDTNPDNAKNYWSPVSVTSEFINARLGLALTTAEIAKLLENVEFHVKYARDDLYISPPFWRTDIEIPEDIVEEVGRLYGYDHLPLVLPKRDLAPAEKNEFRSTKSLARDMLSNSGANEVLTYTFVHGNLMQKVGQDPDNAYRLSNALSPDLQYYRLSLLPSLLDKVHANIKAGHSEFALFEMNPVHGKDLVDENKLPIEDQRLAFVFASEEKAAKKREGVAYYQAKKYLEQLAEALGLGVTFEPAEGHNPKQPISRAAIAPFEKKRAAIVKATSGEFIGELGEFRAQVRKNFKLPDYIAGFEVDLAQLQKLAQPATYQPLSRFPSTSQDISFKIASDVSYAKLLATLEKELMAAGKVHGYQSSIEPLDIYQDKKTATQKHVAFRVTLTHHERTLTTKEVNTLLDTLASSAKKSLHAERL